MILTRRKHDNHGDECADDEPQVDLKVCGEDEPPVAVAFLQFSCRFRSAN
jgi:hypothetical protein